MNDDEDYDNFSMSSQQQQQQQSGEARNRSQLLRDRRLNIPMGERPAATVIRRSKRPTQATKKQQQEKKKEKTVPSVLKIVGDIVERPSHVVNNNKRREKGSSKSLFSKQQRQQKATNPSGFPSVQVPLGTFTTTHNGGVSIRKNNNNNITKNKKHDDNITKDKGIIKDQEASSNSGSNMLSQMSLEEIVETKQELEDALSPNMIEFLRKRGEQKKKKDSSAEEKEMAPKVEEPTTILDDDNEEVIITKEKERIAKVMSSIRTFDDLDEAYQNEFGPTIERKSQQEQNNNNEWENACSLLRSTAPRQTLWAVRVVSHRLEQDWNQGKRYPITTEKSENIKWPYPVLLPISLRCLLDAPVTHTNGSSLHSYTLRCLYALLKLRSPAEHVVDFDFDESNTNSKLLYQEEFFDDAIPTLSYHSSKQLYPPMKAKPLTATSKNDEVVVAAYSTSAISAQADGEAFRNDPMWTLLSRMQIIPRLDQLLKQKHDLPLEGLVAASGILAMLGVRSPGAASAIARHATLLPSLLQKTVMPPSNGITSSNFLNPAATLPILFLLNDLARQSRYAASRIPYANFLPPLLGIDAGGDQQLVKAQKWALVLWRKLLRYGLGFSGLPSLVSLSIKHINSDSSPLATGYCTLFAAWLDCIKIVGKTYNEQVNRLKSSFNNNVRETFSSTLTWLEPSVRQCAETLGKDWAKKNKDDYNTNALSVLASKMRFIGSFVSAASASSSSSNSNNNTVESESIIDRLVLLLTDSLSQIITTSNDAFYELLHKSIVVQKSIREGVMICAFMNELLMLCSTIESSSSLSKEVSSKFSAIVNRLRTTILNYLISLSSSDDTTLTFRYDWTKVYYFSMIKFLLTESTEQQQPSFVVLRSFAINLIGRFRLGDEAKAAILFSKEELFCTTLDTSPISFVFMRELCRTDLHRKQLDHSFKIQRGYGITADELGPFALESLLSETETPPNNNKRDHGHLLPLGKPWLWQVLSGFITDNTSTTDAEIVVEEEVVTIVDATLQLLIDLEETTSADQNNNNPFDDVNMGSKIYYLLNIFLCPESLLCKEEIRKKISILWEKCLNRVVNDDNATADFVSACLEHSQIRIDKIRSNNNDNDDDDDINDHIDPKDEKLLATILNGGADSSSKASSQAIQQFVSDLCDAYQEYGAQYEEFTEGIRLFLMPHLLPSGIRCEVLRQLRPFAHLLVLEKEKENHSVLKSAVEMVLLARRRDSSQVLDLLADILRTKQGGKEGFFFVYAVSALSQALVDGQQKRGAIMEGMKRRLLPLPQSTGRIILETTSRVLSDTTKMVNSVNIIDAAIISVNNNTSSSIIQKNNSNHYFDEGTLSEEQWQVWLENTTDRM